MALKAVIFDFDGTVADSLPLCVAAPGAETQAAATNTPAPADTPPRD